MMNFASCKFTGGGRIAQVFASDCQPFATIAHHVRAGKDQAAMLFVGGGED